MTLMRPEGLSQLNNPNYWSPSSHTTEKSKHVDKLLEFVRKKLVEISSIIDQA